MIENKAIFVWQATCTSTWHPQLAARELSMTYQVTLTFQADSDEQAIELANKMQELIPAEQAYTDRPQAKRVDIIQGGY